MEPNPANKREKRDANWYQDSKKNQEINKEKKSLEVVTDKKESDYHEAHQHNIFGGKKKMSPKHQKKLGQWTPSREGDNSEKLDMPDMSEFLGEDRRGYKVYKVPSLNFMLEKLEKKLEDKDPPKKEEEKPKLNPGLGVADQEPGEKAETAEDVKKEDGEEEKKEGATKILKLDKMMNMNVGNDGTITFLKTPKKKIVIALGYNGSDFIGSQV